MAVWKFPVTKLQYYVVMSQRCLFVPGTQSMIFWHQGKGTGLIPFRAFSDLFGKFLVPMILEKNCVILGKYMTILGKNSASFSKIGKVNLLNWDFSANWECSRSVGNFFSQLGKNLVPETGPSFV